jgi:hypothetical protein
MGSLSNYSEDKWLDHLFNAAYTPVATVYLGLCTADPTDAATGAACNEQAHANGYERAAITFGNAAASRRITQSAICTFPQASGAWSTITHWVIVDSGTHGEGNVLAHGAFSASFSPVSGNTPKVASGQAYIEISASSGAGLGDYAVHKMLDLMFRNQAFTSPQGNTFIALLAAVPDDQDLAVSDLTEISGTDYARKEVNPNGGSSPTWDLSSGGALDNTHIVTFATPGSGGWTATVAIAIVDSASGAGNVLAWDAANIVDQTPAAGDTVQFAAGAFDVSLT